VAGWGGQPTWLPYGALTESPEYPLQYTLSQVINWTIIDWATAQALISTSFSEFGLGSFFNWQSFLVPYYLGDTVIVQKY